jgi:hypothetical protein
MADRLRLRLLAREVELKSYFGTVIAEDLDGARRDSDELDAQLILLTALISTGMKTSRLLWQYGNRASDDLHAAEAESLRSLLGVDDASPLAPSRIAPLAPVLRASALELAEAWSPDTGELILDGVAFPIRDLQDALADVNRRVHDVETANPSSALDWH